MLGLQKVLKIELIKLKSVLIKLNNSEVGKLLTEKLKMNSKDAEEYIETIFDNMFDECEDL